MAAAKGFRPAARRGDELVLTNRPARLVFDKDSRTAQINGVTVAWSFLVAADEGSLPSHNQIWPPG